MLSLHFIGRPCWQAPKLSPEKSILHTKSTLKKINSIGIFGSPSLKMANQIECLCQLDENHHEIGCFFKYVVFLLKRFVSSLNLLTMDPKDEHKDILKNDIWIQIATQYDGYFTGKILKSIHSIDKCMNDSIQYTNE